MIGSNWERNVSSLFVGEEHCVTRQKRLRDSGGDYQVYKYFTNLWNIRSYKIRCYIYEILQLYNKSQIYELILLLHKGLQSIFWPTSNLFLEDLVVKSLKKGKKWYLTCLNSLNGSKDMKYWKWGFSTFFCVKF